MQPKEEGQGEDTGRSGRRETAFNDNPLKVPTAFGMKFKLLPVPTRPPHDATQASLVSSLTSPTHWL